MKKNSRQTMPKKNRSMQKRKEMKMKKTSRLEMLKKFGSIEKRNKKMKRLDQRHIEEQYCLGGNLTASAVIKDFLKSKYPKLKMTLNI